MERIETTTVHGSLNEQPVVSQDRSLAVHVGEEPKNSPSTPSDSPKNDNSRGKVPDLTSELESKVQKDDAKSPENDKPAEQAADIRREISAVEPRDASTESLTQALSAPVSAPVSPRTVEEVVDSTRNKSESKSSQPEVRPPVPISRTGTLGGVSGSITTLHHRQGSENPTTHMEWNKRLLLLYLDLLRLQASTTVKDRGALSKQIFDKYLHPDAPSCVNLWRHPSIEFPLPKLNQRAGAVHPLLIPINNAMESGLAAVQPGVFAPLLKFTELVLKTAFESFCASAKYKERLEQFRLPEQLLTALDDKQAEQESEDRLWEESCVVRFEPQLEYIDPVNYSTLPS